MTGKITTPLRPERVRTPSPLLTLVSRSSTCPRSPTMQPAPPLQVNVHSSTPLSISELCRKLAGSFLSTCQTLISTASVIIISCSFPRKSKSADQSTFPCRRRFKVKLNDSQVIDANIATFVSQKDPSTNHSCQGRERTGSTGHTAYRGGVFVLIKFRACSYKIHLFSCESITELWKLNSFLYTANLYIYYLVKMA